MIPIRNTTENSSCLLYGELFELEKSQKQHKEGLHGDGLPYKCGQWSVACLTFYKRRQHLISHSANKPYLCTKCGKFFNRPHHLKRDLLPHDADREFECTGCPAEFTRRDQLDKHLKAHAMTANDNEIN
ncbi:zinc finger protein 425-like [Varroa destructor]|uniref:C2H2-type domain-containing protein n=1 Tax=Varroa destructor TaxID=109461 RepID=A0A7M7IWH3_VARDE|nr:zinc finger protein 425-like [Varroa destructor]